jgi:gluconokinase
VTAPPGGDRPSLTVVLMGVSGVGKSSVMEVLAPMLHAATAEGDDFHSAANVEKMGAGIPLTDDDRWPWLRSIAGWIGERELARVDAIVTCSALRRVYRDLLRDGHPSVRFVHLLAAAAVVEGRLAGRRGHYMPGTLLESQIRTLEPLEPDEPGFEVLAERPPSVLAAEIVERLGR